MHKLFYFFKYFVQLVYMKHSRDGESKYIPIFIIFRVLYEKQ